MSVGGDFRVDIRPYSGFTDPSLPIAAWIAQAGIAGDASGGLMIMDFDFQTDTEPLTSELFNLEQFSFDLSVATDREGTIETRNMDNLALNRPASPQKWKFRCDQAATGIAALQDVANQLPWWFGSPNRDEGASGIRILMANIDLLLYAATLQGYVWGPRSVLAEGGPQRPLRGLFGH